MQLTEKKSGAIVLIVVGLFGLLNVPMRFAVWAIPGAEQAPHFGTASMTLMIGGGVMLLFGALAAWHAWRPGPT